MYIADYTLTSYYTQYWRCTHLLCVVYSAWMSASPCAQTTCLCIYMYMPLLNAQDFTNTWEASHDCRYMYMYLKLATVNITTLRWPTHEVVAAKKVNTSFACNGRFGLVSFPFCHHGNLKFFCSVFPFSCSTRNATGQRANKRQSGDECSRTTTRSP